MNNTDYPVGSDTSDAPWNEQDYGDKECPVCMGDKYLYYAPTDSDGEYNKESCHNCDGSGVIPMNRQDHLDRLESKREDMK